MRHSNYEHFRTVFRGICWAATVILLCYWLYFFALDEDICLVDYKEYYDTPTHTFPLLSICLKNPFSNEKFSRESDEINPESYVSFLQGTHFNAKMTNITYKSVLLNISEYVNQYWIEWRNGNAELFSISKKPREIFRSSFSGFYGSRFYNCYSLQIPHDKAIMAFQVELKNDIFPLGIRDNNYSTFTLLHAPNQLLTSGQTLKFTGPMRKANDSYALRFKVKGVEILKRRNKRLQQCHENTKNYDFVIIEEHAKRVGCSPPYHDRIDGMPVCATKEKIAASRFSFRFDNYGVQPPCEGIEKIYYTVEEDEMEGTDWINPGNFWIGSIIHDPKFKEIIQKRAIDIQGLVGYMGGYIGLFLGYSIIQIPDFISPFMTKCRNYFTDMIKS